MNGTQSAAEYSTRSASTPALAFVPVSGEGAEAAEASMEPVVWTDGGTYKLSEPVVVYNDGDIDFQYQAYVQGTVEIKDLTVSGARVTVPVGDHDLDTGGVIVGYYMPWPGTLTFTNCKVVNSTVTSNMYAAGLLGYAGGSTDPTNANAVVVKSCEVTGCEFTGSDATGALVALNNHPTVIDGATVTNNTIDGGSGYSAAALVGTSMGGTTATDVTADENDFTISGDRYQVNNSIFGYVFTNNQSYSVDGADLN